MKIEITAPGVYNSKGEEIAVGTEWTVKDEPKAWAGRYRILSGGEAEEKTPVTNPAEAQVAVGPYEAKEKSAGWWGIFAADGSEVGKSLRKDDGEAFNTSSDEDKAAFVAEHAKA